jgi:hypothetical protein
VEAERNLEVVRRWLSPSREHHFSEAEFHDRIQELWDPEATYHPSPKLASAEPSVGREAIEAWYQQWFEGFERWRFELLLLEPLPGDRVLAHTRVRGKGRASGAEVDAEIFFSIWMRHGRFLRLEDHLTERGARRALGLEE